MSMCVCVCVCVCVCMCVYRFFPSAYTPRSLRSTAPFLSRMKVCMPARTPVLGERSSEMDGARRNENLQDNQCKGNLRQKHWKQLLG